jgi:hypothetical protein
MSPLPPIAAVMPQPRERQKRAISGCEQMQQTNSLFDHLVGTDSRLGSPEAAVENETLKTAAKVNSIENFKPVFDHMLEGLFIDRMEGNEDIFDRLMNDSEFRNIAANELLREVYNRLRINTQNRSLSNLQP